MLLSFKKTRIAGAMALAFTMAATAVGAGGAVQTPAYGGIPAPVYGIGLAELVQANHKNNNWRNNWCRQHPRRCRGLSDRGHDGPRFLRGHCGSKVRRHGHRRHNDGWWYPLAAFAFTAYLLDQQHQNHNQGGWNHIPRRNIAKHDAWCDWKYKSYSHRTKTFQPYHGPRKFCNSPYDLL